MPNFTVSPLQRDQIPAAWPLVRMAAPDVPFKRWKAYAADLIEAGGGILGVFAGDATLHGVATYRPEDNLRFGRALRVDTIVTFELNRNAPARRVLSDALDLIAEGFGCGGLVFAVGGPGYADRACAKTRGWNALGLSLDAVLFAKKIAPEAVESAA